MSDIEKIKRYVERTKAPDDRWALSIPECLSLVNITSKLDAVVLAYDYGKAKGYRAAKAGR